MNPNLTLTDQDGRRSNDSKRSSVDKSGDDSPYTYIPNDPRSFFRLLMNMCMDIDTNVSPDSERAKTSVLSQSSEDLLRECSNIWRLSAPFRSVLYLELIKTRMDTEEIDIIDAFDDVREAIRSLDKCLKENEIRNWTINDVR